jgi:hypothetical protein
VERRVGGRVSRHFWVVFVLVVFAVEVCTLNQGVLLRGVMSWWVGEKGVGGLGVIYGVGERYGEEQRSCL